jgi:FG-GAP repeat/FG-GAP-like repeat
MSGARLATVGVCASLLACNAINGLSDVPAINEGLDGATDGPTPHDAGHDARHHDAGHDAGHPGKPDVAPHYTAAPRQLSPLSTSSVTSQKPTFRWVLPEGVPDATIDLCTKRDCIGSALISSTLVSTDSFTPSSPLSPGVVFWRVHPGTDLSLSSKTWEISVGHLSAPFSASWGTILDVNGDGYSDVAISAPGTSQGTGSVYVYLGGPSQDGGLAMSTPTVLSGPGGPNGSFGGSVRSAGDVNGDGYADLIVGAETLAGDTGQAYVFLGGPTGISTSAALTLNGPDGGTGAQFGSSVTSAGDVNGDGYGDIAVGAPGLGAAYVYFGGEGGVIPTPATSISGPGGPASLFGHMGAAGDVNGDGFGDLVVGAPGAIVDGGGGNAYLFYGGSFGVAAIPNVTLISQGGPTGAFGDNVVGAGDINGDGFADVLVGAAGGSGEVYVYLGGMMGISAAPTINVPGPMGVSQEFGVVSGAGDINGDGYGDFAVGAPLYSKNGGIVYVYLGGVSPDGGLAIVYEGSVAGTADGGTFGLALRSAGDVNRDGFDDLVVGAPSALGTTGSAYLYFGGDAGVTSTSVAPITSPALAGDAFGSKVFGASN